MSRLSVLPAAFAAAAIASVLHAEPLDSIEAQKVDLGALAGVAYYTVEPDGYRLVATLVARGTDTPFRFVATLAPGQRVTLSAGRDTGEPATEVHFTRRGERLVVDGAGADRTANHAASGLSVFTAPPNE
jgi:hypothetical protein